MRRDFRSFDRNKRTIDIVVSAIGLIFTAPVQAIVALVVLITHGKPVFFKQTRPGKNGQIFELVKFRTMRVQDEKYVTDEERITVVGRFLRSTSLDEIPTLWNVFKGDMSLVGPRPLLVNYLEHYSLQQARRHEVRPGITGLAQTRGRNSLSWEERFQYDVEYVERRGYMLDLKIILQTVKTVVKREGIHQDGHVTMTPFSGSKKEDNAAD